MPDLEENYVDGMTDEEFAAALKEALRPPSAGVIVFTLEKAMAEGRLRIDDRHLTSRSA